MWTTVSRDEKLMTKFIYTRILVILVLDI